MADLSQIAGTLGFTFLSLIATVVSLYAYLSLRRLDDVLLKARMYMNRQRLFAGFLGLLLSMLVFLVLLIVAIVFMVAGATLPTAAGFIGFGAFFVVLIWAFYNFYAMSRTPKALSTPGPARASEGEGP